MAPSKFNIYVDNSMAQQKPTTVAYVPPAPQPPANENEEPVLNRPRFMPEKLPADCQFYFSERKLYPISGGEFTFEEINLAAWRKRQQQLIERMRMEDLMQENETLRQQVEALKNQLEFVSQQVKSSQPSEPHSPLSNRLSIVPQSLQPAHGGMEYANVTLYGAVNDAPTDCRDFYASTHERYTSQIEGQADTNDKFTVPIYESQYIKENCPTSTPTNKRDNRNNAKDVRRMSRPSMGGSPTMKLSPITETSRDCNSKSSSSSSAMSATPNAAKTPLVARPIEEPDRELDPNDPSTYRMLLRSLSEPLDRRPGFHRLNRCMPKVRQGACFQAGADDYLIDKEISQESQWYTAQLLSDESNDGFKTFCFRVDQPANEWLYYICNELHKRLAKQKSKPDIEASVMIANPAIMYNDGSILVDEGFRFLSLQQMIDACVEEKKPFPKSTAAYITLELLHIIRRMHACDIIHLDINPKNILLICCPERDHISDLDQSLSILKLIGFTRAMDLRLLSPDFKFEGKLDDLMTCEMMDSKLWSYEADWFGALKCIHQMFFAEEMNPVKDGDRWKVDKQFKCTPTDIWADLFDKILNINEIEAVTVAVEHATEELASWIKANIAKVITEAILLEKVVDDYNSKRE